MQGQTRPSPMCHAHPLETWREDDASAHDMAYYYVLLLMDYTVLWYTVLGMCLSPLEPATLPTGVPCADIVQFLQEARVHSFCCPNESRLGEVSLSLSTRFRAGLAECMANAVGSDAASPGTGASHCCSAAGGCGPANAVVPRGCITGLISHPCD
jgi:hypothetical protein